MKDGPAGRVIRYANRLVVPGAAHVDHEVGPAGLLLQEQEVSAMTAGDSRADLNRAIVRRFYEGGTRDDMGDFRDLMTEGFQVFAPRYLPWGGQSDKRRYIDWVIPQVVAILDFDSLSYESLTAEGDHVVAFIDIGVKGTGQSILISEHWDLVDGRAVKLRVAYFEPKILFEALGLPAF
jgi:hypothetical protein